MVIMDSQPTGADRKCGEIIPISKYPTYGNSSIKVEIKQTEIHKTIKMENINISSEPESQNLNRNLVNDKIEKDLNSKILEITMMIKDHYPELSQYLEEMPVTVPSENDPEITLNQLRSYYESLKSLVDRKSVV